MRINQATLLKLQMSKHTSIFHRGVKFFFKKNLLLTNSITSGICMAVGDFVQQEFEFQTKVLSTRYDWERSERKIKNICSRLHISGNKTSICWPLILLILLTMLGQLKVERVTTEVQMAVINSIQELQSWCGLWRERTLNIEARMFAVGMAMGPLHHYYYVNLDKMLPKVNLKTVVVKIMCDQLLASPSTLLCFFFAMGILEKKSIPDIQTEIKKKILYAYMGDCMYWPPVQFINFYFLPPQYRVVYINVATMVFNIFLSFVKHYDQNKKRS